MVVSDMGPLHYLVLVGQVEVLPKLFGRVLIPPAVHKELTNPKTPDAVKEFANALPEWISVVQPTHVEEIPRLGEGLRGAGEREAIALAREVKAEALIVDDKRAIQEAQKRGLETIRLLPILRRAAELELIDDVPSVIDTLIHQTPFYVNGKALGILNEMKQLDLERKQERELRAFEQELHGHCNQIADRMREQISKQLATPQEPFREPERRRTIQPSPGHNRDRDFEPER